jgi:hypothetical protein
MNTNRRPVSVTIISWYLILVFGLLLVSAPFVLNEPETRKFLAISGASPVAALLLSVAGGIAFISAGVAMLKGKDWGRKLYLSAAPVSLAVTIWLYGTKFIVINIPGLVFYGVLLFFLTRPAVSAYFSGSPEAVILKAGVQPGPGFVESLTARKIIGALLLIPGGFILTAWFMMILPMSASGVESIIISGIFGFLALMFIVPAVFLWGWRQWAGLLGTLFVSVGGFLLISAVTFYQLPSMEEFHDQFAKLDPALMGQMAQGSLMFGTGSLVIGGLLILLQRVNSKERSGGVA